MTLPPTIAASPAQWIPAAIALVGVVSLAAMALRRGRTAEPASGEAAAKPAGRPDPAARRRIMLAAGLAVAGATWIIGNRPGLAFAFMAAWYAAVTLLEARRRGREQAAEEAHALTAIGTASRALRAGIPLPGVIALLAAECEGEAGAAFREIVKREEMGEELPSAIRRVLLASELPSLRAFGLALLLQVSAGGNIADASDRLARSLVDRNRVRRRARTIVAYGRAAATLLGLLPLVVVPLLVLNVDGYSQFLFDRPIGNMLLAISAALVATGLIVVQRMCRIEQVRQWRAA